MTAKAPPTPSLPTLPVATHDAEASKEIMRTLRHFHLGNPRAREQLDPPCESCLPALLDPFRDNSRLRYEYPLFLHTPDEVVGETEPARLAQPLSVYLQEIIEGFATNDSSARMLKDNLPWIERDLRRKLDAQNGTISDGPLLSVSADALIEQLQLDPDDTAKLRGELDQMLAAIADNGQLLGYERYPAIHLLIHTIRGITAPRHARFRAEIEEAIRRLKVLLQIEKDKSLESIEPARVRDTIGPAAGLIDVAALSEVMDHSTGSLSMPAERMARIKQSLETLSAFKDESVLVRIIFKGNLVNDEWLERVPGFEAVSADDPCSEAMQIFDQEAARLAKVFAAARIAYLEIENIYDPAIHDPWFENFGWEAFSKDELLLVPAVIALEGADRMAGEGMISFSHLLNSGRPVQVFVRVQAHNNPGRDPGEDEFKSFRTELGYLGLSHRQAFVSQTSAARHAHLIQGYLEALEATRTSLHLINTGLKTAGNNSDLNAWLVAGSALEGRVHPFFRVNPGKGDSSAERVAFDGNPQPELDWPVHPFQYQDESGATVDSELPFTFADYCLLMSNLRPHYALVPPQCVSDDLVTIGEYLSADDDSSEQVPYVWAVDSNGTLQRAVISRALVHACRDRRNFWRTLQEISGVKNRHVELAVTAARVEIQAAADTAIAATEARHEQDLQAARSEAAGEVMQRLTDMLMGMDFGAPAMRPMTSPAPAATASTAEKGLAEEEPAADTTPEAAPAEKVSEEAWIDTALCTSCNDCLAINPQVFVYNDENQAYIADAGAGTYAQLVEAAEACPSSCIHPGQPLDPNEPGLDELRLRGAAFG